MAARVTMTQRPPAWTSRSALPAPVASPATFPSAIAARGRSPQGRCSGSTSRTRRRRPTAAWRSGHRIALRPSRPVAASRPGRCMNVACNIPGDKFAVVNAGDQRRRRGAGAVRQQRGLRGDRRSAGLRGMHDVQHAGQRQGLRSQRCSPHRRREQRPAGGHQRLPAFGRAQDLHRGRGVRHVQLARIAVDHRRLSPGATAPSR